MAPISGRALRYSCMHHLDRFQRLLKKDPTSVPIPLRAVLAALVSYVLRSMVEPVARADETACLAGASWSGNLRSCMPSCNQVESRSELTCQSQAQIGYQIHRAFARMFWLKQVKQDGISA